MIFGKKLCIMMMLISMFALISAYAQPPELTYPTNGMTCLDQNLELRWTSTFGAVSYKIEVSPVIDFITLTVDTVVTSNKVTIFAPGNDTKYFWRVYAKYSDNTLSGTNKWTFTTKRIAPIVLTPFNNLSCSDTNVVFKWRYDGSTSFRIQISEKADFSTVFVDNANLSDTTYKLKLPKFATSYYWRVYGLLSGCPSVWSATRVLTTKDPAPNQFYPANNTKGGSIFTSTPFNLTLKWNKVANATSYAVQVTKDPSFNVISFEYAALTDTTVLVNLPTEYDSTYYWRTKAIVNTCTSYWQTPSIFMTPLKKSLAILPINDSSCVSLTNSLFKWSPVSGTIAYRIQVSDTISFTKLIADSTLVFNNQINLKLKSPLKKHYWRVRGEDSRNSGLWSDTQTFFTTNSSPELLLPLNNEMGTSLSTKLQWQAYDTSYHYAVQVATDKNYSNILISQNNLVNNFLNITLPTTNKTYYWRVLAFTSSCTTDWSSSFNFLTVIGAPQLVKPANRETKVSIYPQFEWSKVDSALTYDIEVYTDSTLSKLFKFKKDIKDNKQIFAGEQFAETTTYYWRVRSSNIIGNSIWSNFFRFTTGVILADAPTLLVPSNSAEKVPTEISLIWTKEKGADKYEIQISLNPEFTNLLTTLTQTDSTIKLTGLINYTYYYWRVRSLNDRGISAWSTVFQFRTIAIAPDKKAVQLLPLDGLKDAANNLTFQWESVPRALGYQLQIAKTNDFPTNSTDFDYEKVWETSKLVWTFSWNTKYFWRVRGWNESGQAPWSDIRMFTVINPASVEELINTYQVKVYPNPTSDQLQITMDLIQPSKMQFVLMTCDGKIVYTNSNDLISAGNYLENVNVSNLPSGAYFYMLSINDKTINGNINIIR